MQADGRVVDGDNGGVSHSEGQGWGLTFATEADDRETFDRILGWTDRNLRVRDDGLCAWRYLPGSGVTDQNNATDGDVFMAFALARAARHWNVPAYRVRATQISEAIVQHLVRPAASCTVLLPGAVGFERERDVVVNPSYYPFFAFAELARLGNAQVWSRVWADGLKLVTEARFGRFGLPPDWLAIDRQTGVLSPGPGWLPRFSYDAIRVPLYLALSRMSPPGLTDGLNDYWAPTSAGFGSAWIDLRTDALAPYGPCPGFRAVQRLWLTSQGLEAGALSETRVHEGLGYYSSALILLATMSPPNVASRA